MQRWYTAPGSWRGLAEGIRISGWTFVILAAWLLLLPIKWLLGLIFAAGVHELGHLAAIWLCGGRVLSMEIRCFGAVIRTAPMDPGAEFLCVLAGPAAGGLLCLFWPWMPFVALCAGVQTLFNLLPVRPLDGWRAVKLLLDRRREKEVANGVFSGYNNSD